MPQQLKGVEVYIQLHDITFLPLLQPAVFNVVCIQAYVNICLFSKESNADLLFHLALVLFFGLVWFS